jgi:hypothetical protein
MEVRGQLIMNWTGGWVTSVVGPNCSKQNNYYFFQDLTPVAYHPIPGSRLCIELPVLVFYSLPAPLEAIDCANSQEHTIFFLFYSNLHSLVFLYNPSLLSPLGDEARRTLRCRMPFRLFLSI